MTDLDIFKDLLRLIENNINEITTLQDIDSLHGIEQCLPRNADLNMSEEELYSQMNKYKRIVQLSLNTYFLPKVFLDCVPFNYQESNSLNYTTDYYTDKMKYRKNIIECICKYILYRQTIFTKCNLLENYDSLMDSICFYCDQKFEFDLNNCNFCGANTNELKDYAIIHRSSLRRKNKFNKKILQSTIKVSNSASFEGKCLQLIKENVILKDDTNVWKCFQCDFLNKRNNSICDKCDSYKVEEIMEGNNESNFNDQNVFDKCNHVNNISNINIIKDNKIILSNEIREFLKSEIMERKTTMSDDSLNKKWECIKCGLINTATFCEACLNQRNQYFYDNGNETLNEVDEVTFDKINKNTYDTNKDDNNDSNKVFNRDFQKISISGEEDKKDISMLSYKKTWKCNKCGLINTFLNCEACLTRKDEIPVEHLNDIDKLSKTNFNLNILINKKSDQNNMNAIKNLIYKIRKNDQEVIKTISFKNWFCKVCGMKNTGTQCENCIKISIENDEWKCENCANINNSRQLKCKQCYTSNKNMILCNKCKTVVIAKNKDICGKCLDVFSSWYCWYPKCRYFNNGNVIYCTRCGIQSTRNFNNCLIKYKGEIVKVWICEFCYVVNDKRFLMCKNKVCKSKKKF